jgi:hypothetical protein
MRSSLTVVVVVLLASTSQLFAPPPLVTGDVPTADKGHVEIYVGMRYQDTGTISRQIPFTEFVYGITERQEITFEVPYLSRKGEHGFGESVIGTKYLFLRETESRPGIAGSFELKVPTGDEARGLGNGEFAYDLRLRTQKTWEWFTGIINIGYTFNPDASLNGFAAEQRNVLFTSFAQEYQVAKKTKLLSEIYWLNNSDVGEPSRLAANIGFKQKITRQLTLHGSIGKSLRESNRGGPALRFYVGVKYDFDPRKMFNHD